MKGTLYLTYLFPISIVYRMYFKQHYSISKAKIEKSMFTTIVNMLFLFVLFAIYKNVEGRDEPLVQLVFVCVILPILLVYIVNQVKVIVKQRELVVIGLVPIIYIYKKVKKRQREAVEKIIEEWIQNDAKEAYTSNLKNLVNREITLGKGSVGRQGDLIKEQEKSTSIDVYIPIVPIEIELIKKYEQSIHGFNGAQGFYIRSAENLLTVLIKYIEYSYGEKGIELSREIIRQELLSIDELLRKERLPLKVLLAVVKEKMLFNYQKQDFFVLEVLGDNAAQKTSNELSYILDQVEKVDGFRSEITSNFMTDEIRVLSSKYKRKVKEDWRMR